MSSIENQALVVSTHEHTSSIEVFAMVVASLMSIGIIGVFIACIFYAFNDHDGHYGHGPK